MVKFLVFWPVAPENYLRVVKEYAIAESPFEFIWSAMPWHRFPLQSTLNLWERFLSGSPWFVSESGENSPHSKLGVRYQEFYCLRFSPEFKTESPSPGYRQR